MKNRFESRYLFIGPITLSPRLLMGFARLFGMGPQMLTAQKEPVKADWANIYWIQKLYPNNEVYKNKSVAK